MSDFLNWLSDEIKAIALSIFDKIMSALSSLINAIPAPSFLTDLQPVVIPNDYAYFINTLNLDYGLTVVIAAFTLRFIVRRLPFIG